MKDFNKIISDTPSEESLETAFEHHVKFVESKGIIITVAVVFFLFIVMTAILTL